jgi:hypothetical protein
MGHPACKETLTTPITEKRLDWNKQGRRQKFAFSLKLYLIAGKKFSIREELE